MQKHFVEFFSPGTFVSESSVKEIHSWDVELAKNMAFNISERYNATPYGFRFITRSRNKNELDSKITKTSCMYYLGGEVLTLADVEARNDPNDEILISNMKANGIKRIIVNTNSWRFTGELKDNDVVLDFIPKNRRNK